MRVWPVLVTCGGQAMNKPMFYSPHTTLILIYQPRRDGWLGRPGQKIRSSSVESVHATVCVLSGYATTRSRIRGQLSGESKAPLELDMLS